MRKLTSHQVETLHGGVLPPDAVLAGEDAITPSPRSPPRKGDPAAVRGRFGLLNAFVDAGMACLTRAEVAVWLVLYRDADAATGTARTAQSDLGHRAGASVRAVRAALAGLVGKGQVEVVRKGEPEGRAVRLPGPAAGRLIGSGYRKPASGRCGSFGPELRKRTSGIPETERGPAPRAAGRTKTAATAHGAEPRRGPDDDDR